MMSAKEKLFDSSPDGDQVSVPSVRTPSTSKATACRVVSDLGSKGMQVVYGQGLLFCIAIEVFSMSEIIFEVQEDEIDGGYVASALGYGIHTQGETLEELRSMVKDAVHCYFDETMPAPKIIRLHFVRDEVLV
jgi:predicted RNase H-like HicB family nuclease